MVEHPYYTRVCAIFTDERTVRNLKIYRNSLKLLVYRIDARQHNRESQRMLWHDRYDFVPEPSVRGHDPLVPVSTLTSMGQLAQSQSV